MRFVTKVTKRTHATTTTSSAWDYQPPLEGDHGHAVQRGGPVFFGHPELRTTPACSERLS